MKLYEITGDILQLLEMCESGEHDEQIIKDTMESLESELEDKAEDYGKVIKNLDANVEVIQKEIDRLMDRKRCLENTRKCIKQRLEAAMLATNHMKIKTQLFTFSIAKNGGKAPLIMLCDEQKLPEEFTKKVADNTVIRNYLESGGKSELFKLGERGKHLLIK